MKLIPAHERGFTLIELSIVLIIISLVTGGILVGRDLIKASEARAQIIQIDKYNSAVNTFFNKYGALPGDMNPTTAAQFGFTVGTNCTGTTQGARDGNGLLDGYTSPSQYYQGFGEVELFWVDLSSVGYIEGSFPNGGAPTIPCGDATYATTVTYTAIAKLLPFAKIGYGNYIYVYENAGLNWYGLSAMTALGNGQTSITSLPVLQAYNIDKKADDGLPTTGSIKAIYVAGFSYTAMAPSANPDSTGTCYNSSTLQYSVNVNGGSGPNCALSFKMISPGT